MIFSLNKAKKINLDKWILRFISLALGIGVWTIVSFLTDNRLIPPPWIILTESLYIILKGEALNALAISLGRILLGFGLAFGIGLLLGIIRGLSKIIYEITEPFLHLFQGVPPILWAIPLLFLTGFGFLSPILVIIFISFPLIAVNITEGMTSIPNLQREMLSIFAPGLLPLIKELVLPHLRPSLCASLKLGFALAVKSSVVAEFFAANNGAGFMLNIAFQNAQLKALYTWGFLIICLIFITDFIFKKLAKLFLKDAQKICQREKYYLITTKPNPKTNQLNLKKSKPNIQTDLLLIENINFAYTSNLKSAEQDHQLLFNQFNFCVKANEIAVISGDSGTGKTTLLKLCAGLLKIESGKIKRPTGRIAFAFQENRLLAQLTALSNVALPAFYAGYDKRSALQRAAILLKIFGLQHNLFYFPRELSGGMQRRVSLARCFAVRPNLILLDEPFTGLQTKARQNLFKQILKLWQNNPCPFLLVTHHPEEIPQRPFIRFYELKGPPAKIYQS